MIEKTEIGHPAKIGNVLGRITELLGTKSDGFHGDLHSIVVLTTPHGSDIKAGLFHFDELGDDDIKQLEEYEAQSLSDKGNIYNNKLNKQ